MLIKVLAVEEPQKIQKGKSNWLEASVSYKDLELGKVSGKKLVSFKYPDVWKFFQSVNVGAEVNVTLEKIDEYWQWTSVNGENLDNPKQEAASNNPQAQRFITPVQTYKPTYETPEERAWKQILIVRQSSVTAAIAILQSAKNVLAVENVLATASQIEAWVNRDKAIQSLIDMPSELPAEVV